MPQGRRRSGFLKGVEDVTVVYFRVDVPEGTLEEIREERAAGWDGGNEDREEK